MVPEKALVVTCLKVVSPRTWVLHNQKPLKLDGAVRISIRFLHIDMGLYPCFDDRNDIHLAL